MGAVPASWEPGAAAAAGGGVAPAGLATSTDAAPTVRPVMTVRARERVIRDIVWTSMSCSGSRSTVAQFWEDAECPLDQSHLSSGLTGAPQCRLGPERYDRCNEGAAVIG